MIIEEMPQAVNTLITAKQGCGLQTVAFTD